MLSSRNSRRGRREHFRRRGLRRYYLLANRAAPYCPLSAHHPRRERQVVRCHTLLSWNSVSFPQTAKQSFASKCVPKNGVWERGKINAELAVALPVSIDNTALQVVSDYRFRGGIAIRF